MTIREYQCLCASKLFEFITYLNCKTNDAGIWDVLPLYLVYSGISEVYIHIGKNSIYLSIGFIHTLPPCRGGGLECTPQSKDY